MSAGLNGRYSDIDGTCADPVTAHVMMTLRFVLVMVQRAVKASMSVSDMFAGCRSPHSPYLVVPMIVRYDLTGKVYSGQSDVPRGHPEEASCLRNFRYSTSAFTRRIKSRHWLKFSRNKALARRRA